MIIRRIIAIILFGEVLAACSPPPENPDEFLEYAWAGAVTDSTATIAFKTSRESKVRMILSTDKDFKKALIFSEQKEVKKKDFLTSKVSFDSLQPNTTYHYRLEMDGEMIIDPDFEGEFKTFRSKPFSYKIAFASCARTGSHSRIFRSIAQQKPLFYMNTGDLHYQNINSNCEYAYAEAFFDIQRSPSQAYLYKHVPFVYMWDDHDYGVNNSAEDANCKREAIKAYKRYVPHYPLAFDGNNDPVSQSFTAGRVRYVLTDLRSQKQRPEYSGCEKTQVGTNFGSEEHLKWFEEQLLTAKRDSMVVAWISGIPWISDERSRKYECDENDDWGGFQEERREIANFIKEYEIPIFMICGDAHMVAIDDGTNSDYATGGGAPIPVFQAAPLDNFGIYKGGPYSNGYSVHNGQFGTMEVIDNGQRQICIEWRGLNKYGHQLLNQAEKPLRYRFCLNTY